MDSGFLWRALKMQLSNDKLKLISSDQTFPPLIVDFYKRNRNFLAPYEPMHDDYFYYTGFHELVIAKEIEAEKHGENYRFYIFEKNSDSQIIGIISLANIIKGCFCSCILGYKMDETYLNRGYMTMAIQMVVDFAFKTLSLHRIEANVMPWNKPSLRVLEKNGFDKEGISRKYLKINGRWEDHIRLVLLNEHFQ